LPESEFTELKNEHNSEHSKIVIVHRKDAKSAKSYLFSFPFRVWKAENNDPNGLLF